LRVVEAGYEWIEDDRAWLGGIAEAAAPFGIGTGTAVYEIALENKPHIARYVSRDAPASFERAIRGFTTALGGTAREMYSPTEFVGNAGYRLRRLAKARGTSVNELTRGNNIAAWALVGGDPRTRSLAIVYPGSSTDVDPEQPFPRARVLGLAAAHLGAALRLRELAAPKADTDGITESVLAPSGKVLHATGTAKTSRARESLVEAVTRRERARGRMRRVDAEEAAQLWSVLVSGRWSIVDFVDRDGKRLLLARKNPVAGPDVLALTAEERDVVWLATHGHSRKYIAYELGISVSQVGRRLAMAMRKLRVDSRRDLLQRFSGS
jgi:DNA-binding CsgD family transcriptional regulator